ncbi:MAG: hypothetical protein SVU32_00055, partial [Candidatus Nanohaloarchaea archaeon]|nr:hypothetical protein [Candidatus Nanohaloarchaea archaeon]
FLAQTYGLSVRAASGYTLLGAVGLLLGPPSVGWLSDRLGRRTSLIVAGAAAYVVAIGTLAIWGRPPLPVVATVFFAIGFLWLARSRWGGDVGRYFEIVSVGLFIQLLTYVPHLSWHLKAAGKGPQALPAWGMSSNFWYVFWHGAAAMSFAFIAYGFYLYWQSTE